MYLTLSRVEPSDFDAILPVLFEAFDPIELSAVFFGKASPENLSLRKKMILESFHNDPADTWLKITDEDEEIEVDVIDEHLAEEGEGNLSRKTVKGRKRVKRIVCASNWKVYPTFVEPKQVQEVVEVRDAVANGNGDIETMHEKKAKGSDLIWLPTPAQRADAHIILEDFLARRRRTCREGHILLYILFVDPAYQRKGAGAMMVEWGCMLADQLMLPAWVEASSYGHGLYKKYGFEDVENVRVVTNSFVGEYTHMRRPVKVRGFTGKELVKFY